jgi:hypothetical protein
MRKLIAANVRITMAPAGSAGVPSGLCDSRAMIDWSSPVIP